MIKLFENLYIPENFEENHHYYADEEGTKEYTGITTILGVLAKPALIGWAAKMAVEYIEAHLDEEGVFLPQVGDDWKTVLKEAKVAHAKVRDNRAKEGTNTHAEIEGYIKACISLNNGNPIPMNEVIGDVGKFSQWAQENVSKFLGSEQKFYSKSLWVAGTCDFTFERKDGKRFLGDIKTYKKIWDNIPFAQCAGYAIMSEEMGEEPFYGYCIVNLPPDGELECMWNMDVEGDKKAFLSAVNLYRFIKKL